MGDQDADWKDHHVQIESFEGCPTLANTRSHLFDQGIPDKTDLAIIRSNPSEATVAPPPP